MQFLEPSAVTLSPERALRVLSAIPHVGPVAASRLLTAFDSDPWRILRSSKYELMQVYGIGPTIAQAVTQWRTAVDLEEDDKRMAATGARYISLIDAQYPQLLREISDRPTGLYALGSLETVGARSIAIVGSRRATLYGRAVAKRLAGELAELDFTIISGLARGIDGAAHEGALAVGGKTVAVLGCGVDLIYPPEHAELYQKIQATGLILSELNMGRPADRHTFPMRNRLISGLSQAVIVVESDSNGGSMITAHIAAEQGRHVFAVPGRVDQPSSRGCHDLIRDGATLIRHAQDVFDELSYLAEQKKPRVKMTFPERISGAQPSVQEAPRAERPALESLEKQLLDTLESAGALDLDGLASLCDLSIAKVSSTLLMLEIKKCVVKRVDGKFEARFGF